MPWKPKKPCAVPRCPILAAPGRAYCSEHEAERQKKVNYKRDNQFKKLYNSSQWRGYTKRFLKDNPICIVCGKPSEHTDHIISLQDGGQFWDYGNHQPLCRSCHSRKTVKENGGFGNEQKEK